MPILLPMGWKSSAVDELIYRVSAPSMVVSGSSSGGSPRSRRAMAMPAMSPDEADSIYPSTPVI